MGRPRHLHTGTRVRLPGGKTGTVMVHYVEDRMVQVLPDLDFPKGADALTRAVLGFDHEPVLCWRREIQPMLEPATRRYIEQWEQHAW